MCGRVTLTFDQEAIREILGEVYGVVNEPRLPETPNYNMAPSSQLVSVIHAGDERRAGLLTWGLVPPWTKEKDIKHGLINARSETVDTKPAFKTSFETRRCIVLVNGFYEWKRESVKRPFLFEISDQPLMPIAGVYTVFHRSDGTKLSSCALLTCEPNNIMAPIHNRMPVILTPENINLWLDKHASKETLRSVMVPYPEQNMSLFEVSSYVNSTRNKGIKCIEAINAVS